MSYDLQKYRGFTVIDETPSMTMLYYYSKYKKDREDASKQSANPRVTKAY